MRRVRTREDFIERSTEIHGGIYDYSKVVYVRSNEPVVIGCPIHGDFEQTPNKHLAGQGCRACGYERMKAGKDEFIRRAITVHGNRYGYDAVDYKRKDVKVRIVCQKHGEFLQTPHCHVTLRQGCPRCAAEAGALRRTGDGNPMRNAISVERAQATCTIRYGTKTYAESEDGRRKLSEICGSPDAQRRSRQTCLERYGAECWPKSKVGRSKLHEVMSSEAMKQRIRAGYLAAYGVEHAMKLPSVLEKAWQTRLENGTSKSSEPEESLYDLLCDCFGFDDVVRQHVDAERYPFHCDFYIKSVDLFIELNASWTHGGHWFDETDPADACVLADWRRLAESKDSGYYRAAVDTWIRRDPAKRQCAVENDLNYLVFWDNDLADAKAWLESLQQS